MWQMIRMIGELKPLHFSIENVPGLLSYKDFVYLLMETLEKHGYVVRINMLDACSYGVPQTRKRVFIHGTRNDLKALPKYPAPTHFSNESLVPDKFGIARGDVAQKAFYKNGFPKEQLKDLWWNTKLWIYMNKREAADIIYQAYKIVLIEAMLQTDITNIDWIRLKLPEIKQSIVSDYMKSKKEDQYAKS